jgi:HAD superfamily hydrolase (TIGR01490 family)
MIRKVGHMILAIYDFDGTYIHAQTVPLLFKLWKSMHINDRAHKVLWGKITRWYILHKLHIKWDKETFRRHAMALTVDLLHSVDENTMHAFLERFYEHATSYVNQDLKHQLKKDRDMGYTTVLLSGSFDIMLEPFKKDGFHHVIGTPTISNGITLDSKSVQIIINQKKVKAVKDLFKEADFKQSKAYADSYYDIALLESVGKPIAYHPDTRLLKHAQTHQWEIIDSHEDKT